MHFTTADKTTHMDLTTADKATHMDLTMMDKATDVDLAYEDSATQTEQLDKQLKEQEQTIGFLRQQVRNRDALITDCAVNWNSRCRRTQQQIIFAEFCKHLSSKLFLASTRRKKNAASLERTSRRNLAEKIVDVIDRDRSRSLSRCSLQTLHREVRHKFGHYTPMKNNEQLRQQQTIHEEDGLLLLSQLGTQKAYERMKAVLRLIGGKFDIYATLQYEAISTPHGIGFFCSDIAGALEFRLSAAKDNLINFRSDELILKLSGDNGQSFTKITISLNPCFTCKFSDQQFHRGSIPRKGQQGKFEQILRQHLNLTTEETVKQAEQFGRLVENGEKPTVAARALTKGIVDEPLLRSIEFDRMILAPFHAQPLSPRDLDELETSIDQFRTFLNDQPRMRTLLALKPKVHLLLNHFVPFARQHQFLALLDEQGDEALHSVWRRLEQLWKTMPDEEQMRQLLEHHFVSNWLLDTGKIDEMKRDREEQREEIGDRRKMDEESDGEEEQFDFE
ncbi:hypothetical protein niasHT_038240 [Heterodera trifolii]|uniref:Uncharacterized protein n=1 Tax=Heterodera trifolii TaxID=157864 RepID=A0ABD2I0E6_9BILA